MPQLTDFDGVLSTVTSPSQKSPAYPQWHLVLGCKEVKDVRYLNFSPVRFNSSPSLNLMTPATTRQALLRYHISKLAKSASFFFPSTFSPLQTPRHIGSRPKNTVVDGHLQKYQSQELIGSHNVTDMRHQHSGLVLSCGHRPYTFAAAHSGFLIRIKELNLWTTEPVAWHWQTFLSAKLRFCCRSCLSRELHWIPSLMGKRCGVHWIRLEFHLPACSSNEHPGTKSVSVSVSFCFPLPVYIHITLLPVLYAPTV